jgi:sulfite reductase (coenzyme F420)
VLGLFCFEAFNDDKLKSELKSQLGVDLDNVKKAQVRQGKFIAEVDGGEVNCKVKDLDCACEEACRFCGDFTSELADVSVGSVGSKKGYSTVIVRSNAGEKLVKNLNESKETVDKQEIVKLAKFKRQRAQKNLAELSHQ